MCAPVLCAGTLEATRGAWTRVAQLHPALWIGRGWLGRRPSSGKPEGVGTPRFGSRSVANCSRDDEVVAEPTVAFLEAGDGPVDIFEREPDMFEIGDVESTGFDHVDDFLSLCRAEPVRPDDLHLLVHEPLHVDGHRLGYTAHVDDLAAATHAVDRVQHGLHRSTGTECADDEVGPLAVGHGLGPLARGLLAQPEDFD